MDIPKKYHIGTILGTIQVLELRLLRGLPILLFRWRIDSFGVGCVLRSFLRLSSTSSNVGRASGLSACANLTGGGVK
jgi:hypothetical protein